MHTICVSFNNALMFTWYYFKFDIAVKILVAHHLGWHSYVAHYLQIVPEISHLITESLECSEPVPPDIFKWLKNSTLYITHIFTE